MSRLSLLREFLVVEEEWRQGSAHVPLQVVGEHAEEDVSSDATLGSVVNGTHEQIEPR